MGVQASTDIAKQKTDVATQVFNQCPNVSASNTVDLNNVTFRPNPLCYQPGLPPPKFDIDQNAGVQANCVVDNMQKELSKEIAKLDAQAQGGLGFQFSTNADEIENQLTEKIENSCGNQSATNTVNIDNTVVTACQWHFVQNATAKSSCQINNMQDLSNRVAQSELAKTTGFFGGSWGTVALVIIAIVVVAVAIAVIYFLIRGKKTPEGREYAGTEKIADVTGEPETEGLPEVAPAKIEEMDGGGRNKIYGLLVVVAPIIVVLFALGKKNRRPFPADIAGYQQSVADARRIANLEPESFPTNQSKKQTTDNPFRVRKMETGLDDFYKPLLTI